MRINLPKQSKRTVRQWRKRRQQLLKEIKQLNTNKFPLTEDARKERLKKSRREVAFLNQKIRKLLAKQKVLSKKQLVKYEKVTGITQGHNKTLIKYSIANDVVNMWRPVNPQAAERLGSSLLPYMGKGMNVKGKSSEFSLLAGDVPCDAGLSKLAVKDPDRVAEYQLKNEEALKKDQKTYAELQPTPDNIAAINEQLLLTSVVKQVEKDGQQHDVYYAYTAANTIMQDDNGEPVFMVRDPANDNHYFFYQPASQAFTPTSQPLAEGCQANTVEIMAYRQLSFDDGQLVESTYPVTADYDELASAARKIFPMFNNTEIQASFSQVMYQRLARGEAFDPVTFVSELILSYELAQKRSHREAVISQQQPLMGKVTDWQRASKAHLKAETQGATNHGPETTNPWPEKFAEDKHPVYLPNGQVRVLNNEQEVCDFINEQRALGFPLDVNPKWGWKKNSAKGQLFIPNERFNWQTVREDLELLHGQIQSQEEALATVLGRYNIKDSQSNLDAILRYVDEGAEGYLSLEKNSESMGIHVVYEQLSIVAVQILKLRRARAAYVAQMAMMHLQSKIEALRLEADIVYSECLNSAEEMPVETPKEAEFRREVMARVQSGEREHRGRMIAELETQLAQAQDDFFDQYDELDVISKETIRLAGIMSSSGMANLLGNVGTFAVQAGNGQVSDVVDPNLGYNLRMS